MKPKHKIIRLFPVIMFFLFACGTSFAQIEVDTSNMGPPSDDQTLQDFKDSLSSKGDWVKITQDEVDPESVDGEDSVSLDDDIYTDEIWVPNPVIIWVGWNPYCNGRWVWTYWGWQWIPYDNWGWCTYHYGRWWWHHHYGWVWSPGHRWRHCWVSWHRHHNYWGWHPLTPRIHYKGGVSVLPVKKNPENDGWVFVNKKDFTKPVDKKTIIDVNKHTEILKNSTQSADNEVQKKKKSLVEKTQVPTTDRKQTTKTREKPNIYGKPNDAGKEKGTPKNHESTTGKRNNENSTGRHNDGSKSNTNHNSNSNNKSNHNGNSHNSWKSNNSGNSNNSGKSNNPGSNNRSGESKGKN